MSVMAFTKQNLIAIVREKMPSATGVWTNLTTVFVVTPSFSTEDSPAVLASLPIGFALQIVGTSFFLNKEQSSAAECLWQKASDAAPAPGGSFFNNKDLADWIRNKAPETTGIWKSGDTIFVVADQYKGSVTAIASVIPRGFALKIINMFTSMPEGAECLWNTNRQLIGTCIQTSPPRVSAQQLRACPTSRYAELIRTVVPNFTAIWLHHDSLTIRIVTPSGGCSTEDVRRVREALLIPELTVYFTPASSHAFFARSEWRQLWPPCAVLSEELADGTHAMVPARTNKPEPTATPLTPNGGDVISPTGRALTEPALQNIQPPPLTPKQTRLRTSEWPGLGKHWRILATGALCGPGDEHLATVSEPGSPSRLVWCWLPVCVSGTIGKDDTPVRRRVRFESPGWRWLDYNEQILEGDQFLVSGLDFRPAQLSGTSNLVSSPHGTRRRFDVYEARTVMLELMGVEHSGLTGPARGIKPAPSLTVLGPIMHPDEV